MSLFRRLYDRALALAAHRHATVWLGALSVAEATVFPIPPDVMLAPMVLADRSRAWRLALLTTLTSVIGGLIGYLIGMLALEMIMPWLESTGYVGAYDAAVARFRQWGVAFVVLAGFSPIPFKIITLAAGALGMPVGGFLAGSLVGRGARFYLVASIIYAGGERAADNLRRYVDTIGWSVVVLCVLGALVWWLW